MHVFSSMAGTETKQVWRPDSLCSCSLTGSSFSEGLSFRLGSTESWLGGSGSKAASNTLRHFKQINFPLRTSVSSLKKREQGHLKGFVCYEVVSDS